VEEAVAAEVAVGAVPGNHQLTSNTRTSSDKNMSLKGFHPVGEGYAGGIVSAAVYGLKAAEIILKEDG